MNQVLGYRPENIEHPQLPPHQGGSAIISKVVTVVANFFRTSGHWLVETSSWLKDRVIDLFPEQVAMYLDPRRIFVRTILEFAPGERAAVLENALPYISPQMDQNTKDQLIQLVNDENPRSPLLRSMLPFITPDMYSLDSIEITATIVLAFTDVPALEKANFIQHALELIHPEMDANDRFLIIRLLACTADQRANVIQHALELITPQMDIFNRCRIIEHLGYIDADRRANYVQAFQARVLQNAHAVSEQGIDVPEGDFFPCDF